MNWWTFSHRPDEEIVQDLCALLTLFSRRFITVAGKVGESYKDLEAKPSEALSEWPFPMHGAHWRYWPDKPATVIVTPEVMEGKWRARQEVNVKFTIYRV